MFMNDFTTTLDIACSSMENFNFSVDLEGAKMLFMEPTLCWLLVTACYVSGEYCRNSDM